MYTLSNERRNVRDTVRDTSWQRNTPLPSRSSQSVEAKHMHRQRAVKICEKVPIILFLFLLFIYVSHTSSALNNIELVSVENKMYNAPEHGLILTTLSNLICLQ